MTRPRHPGRLEERRPRRAGGFTLLEMVLALAIFSFAIVGLANALVQALEASNDNARDAVLRGALENRLAEIRSKPISTGTDSVETEIPNLIVDQDIEPLTTLHNQKNQLLGGLYSVKLHAQWKLGDRTLEDTAEVYVNQQ